MGHWSDRGGTREGRLGLFPGDVFAYGLRGATGGAGPWEASAGPGGLRLDVASYGTQAFVDQLRHSGSPIEALEMAMVGLDIVRDELGAVGELGTTARFRLEDQIAADSEDHPLLGAWLTAIIDAVGSRADLDAAITFLEQSRTLFFTTGAIAAINAGRVHEGVVPRTWLPGLLVRLGPIVIEPADWELVRRQVEDVASRARPGEALLPAHLDPLQPQPDKVVAFLDGLRQLSSERSEPLVGATIDLLDPALGLSGASGRTATSLRRGYDLEVTPSGVSLRPPPTAADVAVELGSALDLVGDRQKALDDAQAALDREPVGGANRTLLWTERNIAFSRLCLAESVARGLALSALSLASGDRVDAGRQSTTTQALRQQVAIWESDARHAPPVGGMPGPALSSRPVGASPVVLPPYGSPIGGPAVGGPALAGPALGGPALGGPQIASPLPPVPPSALPGPSALGQPLPGQPLPGQPFPGQPLPGQPLPGQPLPGQPFPGQAGPGAFPKRP